MSELAGTIYAHIVLDKYNQAVIAGSGMKVKQLIVEHLVWGWSPEELRAQHPHLTLGQIHSALAYYWDHREEIDQALRDDAEYVERARQEASDHPFLKRLRRQ